MKEQRTSAPEPFGPVPTQRQLTWHALEFYGFLHFTVNTFTDREWGLGDEAPSVFAPSAFDADQIVDSAVAGGMAGLILTCKHHDGFCLWPSKYTEHSVKSSAWRDGRGDVVREISQACASRGIRFGVYLSPWDRNHAEYARPEYVTYYRKQLQELLTEYGPVFEVWFDGANGGDGYYGGANETRRIDARTYYGWDETWEIVRRLQPEASMFSDVGPDIRWVGNEKGIAGDPCWHTIDSGNAAPGDADQALLNSGSRPGGRWLPAECDVSIRPGWFYHESEDDSVRSPENLLDLYFQSVGRGASLLLNLPPDRRGLVHENDRRSLEEFRKRVEAIFRENLLSAGRASASNVRGGANEFGADQLLNGDHDTYWATDDSVNDAEVTIDLPAPVTFNVAEIRECIALGQRIDEFAIDVETGGGWSEFARGKAVGNRRLIRGNAVTTSRVRLRLFGGSASFAVSAFGLYRE